MYGVELTDVRGSTAEFHVDTPVAALDLVLRAERLGLTWRASGTAAGGTRRLALEDLRALAARHVTGDPDAAKSLDEARRLHERATLARLN